MGGRHGSSEKSISVQRPLQPSEALAEVVGSKALPRTEVTKEIVGIENKLQNPKNKRATSSRTTRSKSFSAEREEVSMFDMTKLVGKHLKVSFDRTFSKPQAPAIQLAGALFLSAAADTLSKVAVATESKRYLWILKNKVVLADHRRVERHQAKSLAFEFVRRGAHVVLAAHQPGGRINAHEAKINAAGGVPRWPSPPT